MATQVAEKGPLGLENPMGTDGFEFVEYAAPDPELLGSLFTSMGFPAVARHTARMHPPPQGDLQLIINASPTALPRSSPGITAPLRLRDGFFASRTPPPAQSARSNWAPTDVRAMSAEGELDIPAIEASAARSLSATATTRRTARSTTSTSILSPTGASARPGRQQLTYIRPSTHIDRGRMSVWANSTRSSSTSARPLLRHEGKVTGLISKAMTIPCGRSASRSTNARTTRARSRSSCVV